MKFSVIIPVYNTEKFLPHCLDSVINQTHADLEIIIVNDGSPGNADEICRKYAEKDPRIKYISQANQGVSVARNNGLAAASGDYIYCVDSDDAIAEDFFAILAEHLRIEQSELVVIGEIFCRTPIKYLGSLATNGLAIKRDFLAKYPDVRYPEKMHPGEDGIFNHKLLALAKKISQCPQATYNYNRDNENSAEHTMTSERIRSILIRFYDILPEFYDKYQLWDHKRFHLLAFIQIEPNNRLLSLSFFSRNRKYCWDITHKFIRQYELDKFSKDEIFALGNNHFYHVVKSRNYWTYCLWRHCSIYLKQTRRHTVIHLPFGMKISIKNKYNVIGK